MTHSDSRIQAALGIGLWERLDELSDDALTENPDSGLAIYAKGIAAMRRREYIEARGHFEVALSRDPNVPNFSHGLAICDFVDNNVQSAENRIRSVLQSHPDYFDGQLFLCWILAKSHQTSRAEIEIRAALTSQPEHPSLLEALLYLRRNVERRRDTEELTRRLLAANPESVTGHLCLADSLLRNNRPAEAAEEIRYCLSKLPPSRCGISCSVFSRSRSSCSILWAAFPCCVSPFGRRSQRFSSGQRSDGSAANQSSTGKPNLHLHPVRHFPWRKA